MLYHFAQVPEVIYNYRSYSAERWLLHKNCENLIISGPFVSTSSILIIENLLYTLVRLTTHGHTYY